MSANEDAAERYVREFAALERATATLKPLLEELCASSGIDASVEVRTKTVASFVKKILQGTYADAWQEIDDKVGARIIVASRADKERVLALFENPPEHLRFFDLEDKAANVDPRQLGYRGFHAQVCVSDHTTSDGQPIESEVQLRTRADDLWVATEHKLGYKGVVKPGAETLRRLMRLSVLTEIFDEEVARVMNDIALDPAYAAARLLRAAETEYLPLVPELGNDDLSLEVIAQLMPALEDADSANYSHALHKFVVEHRDKLQTIFDKFGARSEFAAQFAYWLFTQPESLIVFHLVETRPMVLAQAVHGTELESAVRELYAAWGKAMPDPP